MSKRRRAVLSAASAAVLIVALIGSAPGAPELEVLSHYLTSDVIKNEAGEDDWSYIYAVQVRSVGSAGRVRAKARIATPQGQFSREQIADFTADEAKVLRFVYAEPSALGELLAAQAPLTYEFSFDLLQ